MTFVGAHSLGWPDLNQSQRPVNRWRVAMQVDETLMCRERCTAAVVFGAAYLDGMARCSLPGPCLRP
ncbi:hypothetical protein V2G26_009033 [Clonostachys chloroleuca]